MDIKRMFDYISRIKLIQWIKDLDMDNDFIGWTKLFLTDRSVKFVIDGLRNSKQRVKLGIPQRSLVSPILFLIYINRVFSIIEDQLPYIRYFFLLTTWAY